LTVHIHTSDCLFRGSLQRVYSDVVVQLSMVKLRKVQQTRTGTFFVCLPRSWSEEHGLRKGAQIALVETSNGRLCIDAKPARDSQPHVAVLGRGPFLSREIKGRYLLGFEVIRVEAKERFDFDVRTAIKQTVGSLVGLEIVEETSSQIVLQFLLEPSGFPPERLLARNFAIVSGMNHDAVNSFTDGDLQLAKSVVVRNDESHRQYLLLVRILGTVAQDQGLAEKLGLNSIDCLNYSLAARFVQDLGDAAMQVANEALGLNGVKLSDEMKVRLDSLQKVCFDASDQAVKAFTDKEVSSAENVRSMHAKVDELSREVETAVKNQPFPEMPQLLVVVTLLGRVYDLSVSLADLVG
jgi:phosphate uptake regulator